MVSRAMQRTDVRRVVVARQRYYAAGMHRTAGAACYFGVLTLFPFLGLLYLMLAQLAAADPSFLRRSRVDLQDSLGLSASMIAKLYSAEGTASLQAVLTLVGILGLCYAGVAWMETIRQGLRPIWSTDAPRPWWRSLFRQWLALLVALPSVLLVVGLAVFAGTSPYRLLATDGLHLARPARFALELVALVATVSWSALISYLAYRRIGGARPSRDLRRAAWASGLCLGLLAVIAMLLLPIALSDPYGIVVVILALMLWVSASVRVLLAMAVWSSVEPDPENLESMNNAPTVVSVHSDD
jgi:uncharacterized BrkB/YihY/UPF0761 family membrane protein